MFITDWVYWGGGRDTEMLMLSMELRVRRWRTDWGTSAYPAAGGSLHGRLAVWCWVAAYAGSSVRVQGR